jgi:EpsI family protein
MTHSARTGAPLVRALVLLLAMAIALGIATALRPSALLADIQPRSTLTDEIPLIIQGWRANSNGAAMVIDPTQKSVLDYLYTETFSATYDNARNGTVMLSIAYGRDQRDGHNVHKPDICYPAQGFVVLDQRNLVLKLDERRSIDVRYMKMRNGPRTEPLIYWTTAGDVVYRGGLERKLVAFDYGLRNMIPDGLIVRASTIENDPDTAIATLTAFVHDLYAAMPENQRSRYFGAIAR